MTPLVIHLAAHSTFQGNFPPPAKGGALTLVTAAGDKDLLLCAGILVGLDVRPAFVLNPLPFAVPCEGTGCPNAAALFAQRIEGESDTARGIRVHLDIDFLDGFGLIQGALDGGVKGTVLVQGTGTF